MRGFLIAIATSVLILGMPLAIWYFGRVWNYNLSYKGMVKETIREMVKEDALIWER